MNYNNKRYTIVGVMSGTSLDGLDLVLCEYYKNENKWDFEVKKHTTLPYSHEWFERLKNAPTLAGLELITLHRQYGQWIGSAINNFLADEKKHCELIASHGHTVFHKPHEKVSFQAGDGAIIAAETGITTISDFRTLDIALGGQGAPLVPIGDALLFEQYDVCVNLGGFANLSMETDDRRLAWDICPVNFVLNRLMMKLGKSYDDRGINGRKGKVITELYQQLNQLPYYGYTAPKSLGQEWIENEFQPILDSYNDCEIHDVLRTCYAHFADRITHDINLKNGSQVLFSGGGAKNDFLMALIAEKLKASVVIPNEVIVDYKEAIVFGFLGLLRWLKQPNCLASVTGASSDAVSGVVHLIK
ncbi:anhydro-N-acetylmuramic acid kinase [Marinilabiliaceae bacterium JC017]|nr:anhydro-N-acetylmuramic acid kinase [Marinilabiliaceae bacterium JC017]